MNIKDRMILDEFKKERENFLKLEQVADGMLRQIVKDSNVLVMGLEHRVKKEQSLEVKLYKNGDYYQKMSDLMDLLGCRIICYFADDVDKIGKMIEERFDIDWSHSSDKRKLMQADSFGYLSLHYIVSLKRDEGYPEELVNKRFEIQIRSILQHAWACIDHDLGYKTEFGVPKEVIRQFARLAGLLELADEEFSRTRDQIKAYTELIRGKIINDDATDVKIDLISLREYMRSNKKMQEFLDKIASVEKSEINYSEPDNYILQLNWLKIDTIGELQNEFNKYKDLAFSLAKKTLSGTELDILTSNAALRFICQAKLIYDGYSEEEMLEFIKISVKDEERAKKQAHRLYNTKRELGYDK